MCQMAATLSRPSSSWNSGHIAVLHVIAAIASVAVCLQTLFLLSPLGAAAECIVCQSAACYVSNGGDAQSSLVILEFRPHRCVACDCCYCFCCCVSADSFPVVASGRGRRVYRLPERRLLCVKWRRRSVVPRHLGIQATSLCCM